MHLMFLIQRILADKQTGRQPGRGDTDVENPHHPERIRVRHRGHHPLRRRQRRHNRRVRTRRPAAKLFRNASGQRRHEQHSLLLHAVLEDNTADNDGDGGSQIPREAKRRGRGRDILRFDERLQRDERGLEIRAHAQTGDDLVDDDAGPRCVWGKIDVEAETEGHEEHAEVDGREVLASFADEDADGGGGEGEGNDEGEEVDATQDGGSTEHGLEIEGEEIAAGDEGHAVTEADDESRDVGAPFEEAERHDGVLGDFPFVQDEEAPDDGAEDEEADDGGGGPGEGYAAEFEAE